MHKAIKKVLILAVAILANVACGEASHDKVTSPTEKPQSNDCQLNGQSVSCEDFALFGAELYANNCVRCHGEFSESEIRGATLENINNAIARVPRMQKFSSLTQDERQAIALSLSVD